MEPGGTVEVRMLGGFQVLLPDGTPAGPWARPSARRVVQILVLRERHRIGREELAELLFPELAPERAANAVSKALSMARSALAPFGIVESDRSVIWLTGPIRVDAKVQLATLRQALALPPGHARDVALVAGLEERGLLLDDELYADWAHVPREELEGLRARARVTLARDRDGGHGRASTWDTAEAWREVLAHDPSNEEACSAAMLAHGAAGMRDLVVRTFHRTVAAIHDLGLEPNAHLRHTYSLALKEADEGPPQVEALRAGARTFGREAALAELRDAVGYQRRGQCGTVLVTGPAGIGKSHVLDVLGRELQAAGWLVVQAAAVSGDHLAPLQALRRVLAQLDLATAGPLVRSVANGSGPADAPDGGPADRRRLLDELVDLFDHHARSRPLVVVIDDVHWADAGLQGILAHLAVHGHQRRWGMVLGARSDEAGTTVALPPSVATLALVPLSPAGVAALIRHTEPNLDGDAVAGCVSRSGGYPFFAIELARQYVQGTGGRPADSEVPTLIVELLDTRLTRCSAAARRVLSLVALAGEEPTVQFLLRLGIGVDGDAEAATDATIRTIDELVGAHLLVERPAGVRLLHPLLRDAAVARLDTTRRAELHQVLAGASTGEVAARHRLAAFEAVGLTQHAAPAAAAGFVAGHHARRLFADDAALELFGRGLRAFAVVADADREGLRPAALDAWCRLGDIHLQREELIEAERACQAAMELAMSDAELARVWSAMASLAYRVGDFERTVTSYERAIDSLRGPSPLVRARLEADLGWTYFRLGRPQDSVQLLEQVIATIEDLGDAATRGHALDRLACVLGVVGRAEEGLEVMQRAFGAIGTTGDERQLGILHTHRATLYTQLHRFGEALADAAAALRVATASGDDYSVAVIHWVIGSIHESRGDPSAALAEREAELVLLQKIGNARNAAMAHAARARNLRALGRTEESEDAAASARALAADRDDAAFMALVEEKIVAMGATG